MEELIDILDEDGNKTGRIETRTQVHEKGLWHRIIVVAIIDNNNQILMQQRSYTKDTNPGKWDISVAGHVSAGQTSVEAAIREVEEEVGIHICKENLQYVFTCKHESRPKENYIVKHIHDFYVAKVDKIDMEQITLQESEVESAKLVNREEFQYMVEHENMVKRDEIYKAVLEYILKK